MISFIFASLLLLPALVAGQYGAPPDDTSSSTPTGAALPPVPSPSSATQHIVKVGAGTDLKFDPTTVTAKLNDTVTFFFDSTTFNHSVTQSTFNDPCTSNGGFNSGLQSGGNMFTVTITNETQPIWFYCMQTTPLKHCGMGMVGAINPPSSGNTFSNFQAKANSIGTSEGAQTAPPALSGPGATAAAPATLAPGGSGGSGSNGGATTLTMGASAILAAVAAVFYTLA